MLSAPRNELIIEYDCYQYLSKSQDSDELVTNFMDFIKCMNQNVNDWMLIIKHNKKVDFLQCPNRYLILNRMNNKLSIHYRLDKIKKELYVTNNDEMDKSIQKTHDIKWIMDCSHKVMI